MKLKTLTEIVLSIYLSHLKRALFSVKEFYILNSIFFSSYGCWISA